MKRRSHIAAAIEPEEPPARFCEWPGCPCPGEYPAPKSRHELRRYQWFCLEHVRTYNAQWNYYAGMDDREVEADIRADVVWQRMTWRFGSGSGGRIGSRPEIHDPFGFFDTDDVPPAPAAPPTAEAKAMRVLELVPPVTLAVVKARYKELVKRHHPDANGGDKASEERFKQINEAYRTVIHSLTA